MRRRRRRWRIYVNYCRDFIDFFISTGNRKDAVMILESVKEVSSWQTELGGMNLWADGWIHELMD